MDEKRQVQKELFEDFVSREKKIRSRDFLQKKPKLSINLCFEHLIFVFIGFIIALAVIFSIGVEKGKYISLDSTRQAETRKAAEETERIESESFVFEQQNAIKEIAAQVKPVDAEAPFEFTVQVASYAREEVAKKHTEQLKAQNNDAFVLKKGDYYITCVGKFTDRQSADTQMKKLRKSYSDCIVRKI